MNDLVSRRVVSRLSLGIVCFLLPSLAGCGLETTTQGPSGGPCGDGRLNADISEIKLKYDGYSISLTGSWKGIALRVGLDNVQVQKIEESTQNWNQYIQGVALAHNSCSSAKDHFGKQLDRYNKIKNTRELLQSLIAKIPGDGKISPEMDKQLRDGFDKFYKLISSEV